jgi:hypothetical protein
LITIVIAIATVAIAFLLVGFSFFSEKDGDEREGRFSQGREVLGLFIGILGTVVGFYFGESSSRQGRLEVTPPRTEVLPADSVLVSAFAYGGEPPFTVTITGTDIEAVSSDGWIVLRTPGPLPESAVQGHPVLRSWGTPTFAHP